MKYGIRLLVITGGVCCALSVVLVLGFRPWMQDLLLKTRISDTLEVMRAAAPALGSSIPSQNGRVPRSLGRNLLNLTSAEYLILYDSDGTEVSVIPPEAPDSRRMEPSILELIEQTGSFVARDDRMVDLYVALPSASPPTDPAVETIKTPVPRDRRRAPGFLRLGIPRSSLGLRPLWSSGTRIYPVLSLCGAVLLLLIIFWWFLEKRMQPIREGLRLLSGGDFNHKIPEQKSADLNWLTGHINAIGQELQRLRREIETLSSDPLMPSAPVKGASRLETFADELSSSAGSLYRNLYQLLEYLTGLLRVLNAYTSLKLPATQAQNMEEVRQDTEYDHIIEDAERLVRSCIKAIEKIKTISSRLKAMPAAHSQSASPP